MYYAQFPGYAAVNLLTFHGPPQSGENYENNTGVCNVVLSTFNIISPRLYTVPFVSATF